MPRDALTQPSLDTTTTLTLIVATMILVALVETVIPLYRRTAWSRAHLAPNLTLTLTTFITNALYNAALVAALVHLQRADFGPLRWLRLGTLAETLVVLLALDFSFYVAHVTMHKLPAFWRFHSVHHSDPMVDVTTTVRQHPVEGVIRYVFMASFAIAIGAGPGTFAVYRVASALNGLLEHANVRCPWWLDRALSWLTTWPGLHKLHHSRRAEHTDTNYGNLFSVWDRLFGTLTPVPPQLDVAYGLDGCDAPSEQETIALLVNPFRSAHAASEDPASS